MAIINKYTLESEGAIVPITMTASDTVELNLAKKSSLVVQNDTVGSLTVTVVGDTAASAYCPGIGPADLTGGKQFTVGVGETFKFPLNATYQKWLGDGNLTITGGLDAEAYIIEG